MRVKESGAVVVVDSHGRVVVCKDPIVFNGIVHLLRGWLAIRTIKNVHLTIPRVKGCMIGGFATEIEKHVLRYMISAEKTIVEIDARTRTIVGHVTNNERLCCL